jgi:putative ABC transport system ATP-binding protein
MNAVSSSLPIAIEARGIVKTFRSGENKINALREIDFSAYLGELLMITGPSGCGKTTLLSVLAGTLDFDSGEITVLGASFHQMNQRAITRFRRKNIGFIFQQFNLISTLSCTENVSIPLLLNGVSRSRAEKEALLMLERVGLGGRGKDRPTNLSGGQQQRVAIARALIHSPRLVICDEPTSALDSQNGAHIMEILRDVARDPSRTVIVVTHDSRIFKFADRMTEMDDGRIATIHENISLETTPV